MSGADYLQEAENGMFLLNKNADFFEYAGAYGEIIRRSSALGLYALEVGAQRGCGCFSMSNSAFQSEFLNDELVAPEALRNANSV